MGRNSGHRRSSLRRSKSFFNGDGVLAADDSLGNALIRVRTLAHHRLRPIGGEVVGV